MYGSCKALALQTIKNQTHSKQNVSDFTFETLPQPFGGAAANRDNFRVNPVNAHFTEKRTKRPKLIAKQTHR